MTGTDDETGERSAPARPASSSTQRPRDAATLIVVDRNGPPRILMGRRRPSQIFLPDKFVFPGGRADPIDRSVASADELHDDQIGKLLFDMKGGPSPTRARGLALAALRETFEEAGLLVGKARHDAPACAAPESPAEDAEVWRTYFEHDVVPCLAPLIFIARAITPPGRPRRYDTRFFMVDRQHVAKDVAPPDDELRDLDWFTIEELRRLDLPNITRAVVEDLNEYLALSTAGRPDAPGWRVPYYYFKAGSFERILID